MVSIAKKAQEEMVGLVLIMILVAVIFLVFLGISVRKSHTSETGSTEIYQFLDSLTEFTSECSSDGGFSYKQIDSLAVACDKGYLCESGNPCELLNETVKEIIESSWSFGSESPQKGYEFTADFPSAPQLKLSEMPSTCNSYRGADKSFFGINITLQLCLN